MAYQPLSTSSKNPSQAIYLYTPPLRHDPVNGNLKQNIDMFAHWAVCIQGVCYELTGERLGYQWSREQDWRKTRHLQDQQPNHVGYMTMPYTPAMIHKVASQVWNKTFQGKYIYDEQNCQAFVRYLLDLIADPNTKANLPQFFDKWVKTVGVTRDVTLLGIVGAMSLMGVGLVTAAVDMGSTATAGFALGGQVACSSLANLFHERDKKAKHIKKAQKEIAEELDRNIIQVNG